MKLKNMQIYEQTIRKKIIPVLEKMSDSLDLWERFWEDCFKTGMSGDYGLPVGIYEITIVKTGELTVRGIKGSRATFSIFDDQIKKIYSNLERLEKDFDNKKILSRTIH